MTVSLSKSGPSTTPQTVPKVSGNKSANSTNSRTNPEKNSGFCRVSGVWSRKATSLTTISNGEAVELLSGGHGLASGAAQLPLLHHVHGLDSGDQFLGAPK